MGRGFGIPATPDAERVARIASHCERLGFSSIWANDVPNADGLVTVSHMAHATAAIRLGVGVVPLDRRPAHKVAAEIRKMRLPLDRFVLGVGSGQSEDSLDTVEQGVAILRKEFGEELTIAVAAMAPRMCHLAGRLADLVLFNWMVPRRITWAGGHVAEGEALREKGGSALRAAYIRVALEPGAVERLAAEAGRYNRIPAYRRHFAAMGERLTAVGVAAPPAEVPARLAAYDRVLDESIVRSLPALQTVESTLAVAEAAAPATQDARSPE